MAGIGFELKRLFTKQSIASRFVGVVYSVFSTIGHLLIIIAVLIAIKLFLLNAGFSREDEELYAAIILYCFIFPLIFSSGLCIIISRYIADMMWQKKDDDIMASVYGILVTYSLFASVPAIIFLFFAKLSFILSLFSYIVYMLVGVIFILMVYVSALKDYVQISLSFIIGMPVAFIGSVLSIYRYRQSGEIVTILVGFFALGLLIVAAGIFLGIRKYFKKSSDQYFAFLLYLRKYPYLFFGNTCYTLAMYSQNFVFWLHPETREKVSTFFYSGDFDFASMLGVSTILPAIVLFMVRMETTFYDYFRSYLNAVNTNTGREIRHAKHQMQQHMWQEFLYVAELQIIISFVLLVLGMIVFPRVAISTNIVEIYPSMTCGFLFTYFAFLSSTLLQYFENYRNSFKVMALFLTLTPIFTLLTVLLGSEYYGVGIIFSSAAALVAGIVYLKKTLDDVDYLIFCSQSLRVEEKNTNYDKFIKLLNGRGGKK